MRFRYPFCARNRQIRDVFSRPPIPAPKRSAIPARIAFYTLNAYGLSRCEFERPDFSWRKRRLWKCVRNEGLVTERDSRIKRLGLKNGIHKLGMRFRYPFCARNRQIRHFFSRPHIPAPKRSAIPARIAYYTSNAYGLSRCEFERPDSSSRKRRLWKCVRNEGLVTERELGD